MRSLPNGVGPSCATPLPGSNAATGPIAGVTGLSVTSETGTLSPPIRTQSCATRTQPAGGMRRATLAGSAGIQIARRTARTLWEHWPYWVSRVDSEPLGRCGGHHCREADKLRATVRPTGPRGRRTLRIRAHEAGVGAHTQSCLPESQPSPGHTAGDPSDQHPKCSMRKRTRVRPSRGPDGARRGDAPQAPAEGGREGRCARP